MLEPKGADEIGFIESTERCERRVAPRCGSSWDVCAGA